MTSMLDLHIQPSSIAWATCAGGVTSLYACAMALGLGYVAQMYTWAATQTFV